MTAESQHLDEVPPLLVRPSRSLHLARPGAAELVTHPLLDAVHPSRSAVTDLDHGLYLPVPPWQVPVHRIAADGRTQIGVLLEVAVHEYTVGRVLPHESIRPHAVGALADHLEDTAVDVAPVTLTHPGDAGIAPMLAAVSRTRPALELVSRDGAEHSVWLVDAQRFAPVLDRLARVRALYVVDGHHRCAAGALLASRPRPTRVTDAPDHLFAFVVAPEQLAVASYHLLVGEATQDPEAVVQAVARQLGVAAVPSEVEHVARTEPGVIGMWCGGRWYRFLTEPAGSIGDAATVHERVLGPVFGITAPDDERLAHLPGTLDPRELPSRCPAGTVAFVVHPPPLSALFAAADSGQPVPPKSSYFHPKPPAGLFVRDRW